MFNVSLVASYQSPYLAFRCCCRRCCCLRSSFVLTRLVSKRRPPLGRQFCLPDWLPGCFITTTDLPDRRDLRAQYGM